MCLLRFSGSAPVWRCWCTQKVRDESSLPPPQPLLKYQDWSGGTDYLCKNIIKAVSTSPPFLLTPPLAHHTLRCFHRARSLVQRIAQFLSSFCYSVGSGWWNGSPLSWWRGKGRLIDQSVLSEPHVFCNKKQTPCLHMFWPVITLVWRWWSLNLVSVHLEVMLTTYQESMKTSSQVLTVLDYSYNGG